MVCGRRFHGTGWRAWQPTGIDYTELGAKNADMAVELIEGKPVSEVPVFFFETYQTYLNQNTLDALGITFPEDILKTANVFTDQPAAPEQRDAAPMTRRIAAYRRCVGRKRLPGLRVPEETSGFMLTEAGSGIVEQVAGSAALPRGVKVFGLPFFRKVTASGERAVGGH